MNYLFFCLFCYPSSLTAFEVRRYEAFPEIPGIEPETGYLSIGALAITYVHFKQSFSRSFCHTPPSQAHSIWAIHLSSSTIVWCLSHIFLSLFLPIAFLDRASSFHPTSLTHNATHETLTPKKPIQLPGLFNDEVKQRHAPGVAPNSY